MNPAIFPLSAAVLILVVFFIMEARRLNRRAEADRIAQLLPAPKIHGIPEDAHFCPFCNLLYSGRHCPACRRPGYKTREVV